MLSPQSARVLLNRLGIQVTRWPPTQSLAFARRRILTHQPEAKVVVDVGANSGQWARSCRDLGYAGPIYSFEPIPGVYRSLYASSVHDTQWKTFNLALGSSKRERVSLNVTSNEGMSSSFLDMLPAHTTIDPTVSVNGTEEVSMTTLDNWEDSYRIYGAAYLKCDTQGFEMEVLTGASKFLTRTNWIELETWLVPGYEGAPTFHDLNEFLSELSFTLYALEPGGIDRRSGRCISLDAIWSRDSGL